MTKGFAGHQDNETLGSQYNAMHSIILSILAGIHTVAEVQVVAVTNAGGVSPVGFVDLLPLVNQIDGNGNATPHGVIHSCPYFRLQGGANAIIIDPEVGDIGIGLFAERDISQVIATRAQANPGSGRQYDMSDALYIGGNLNAVPMQYIQFSNAGITVYSPGGNVTLNAVAENVVVNAGNNATVTAGAAVSITAATTATITANNIALNGNTSVSGSLTNNGVDVGSAHAHQVASVQTGSSTIETSAPNV